MWELSCASRASTAAIALGSACPHSKWPAERHAAQCRVMQYASQELQGSA